MTSHDAPGVPPRLARRMAGLGPKRGPSPGALIGVALLFLVVGVVAGISLYPVINPGALEKRPTPTTNTVLLQNVQFVSKDITIKKGEAVTWLNKDGFGHDVTFEDGQKSGEPGQVQQGQTWSRTFTEAGTFRYRCVVHSGGYGADQGMTGTVTVA